MAKRLPRPGVRLTRDEEKRMRQWRACGALSLAILAGLMALYAAAYFLRRGPHEEDHPHRPSAHGGVLMSLGDDEGGHYHVEAIVEKGGILKFYTFGGDADQVLEVETQALTASVRPASGGEPVPVALMPVPQPGDAEGKTSQFIGKLPQELRGKPLAVSIPGITIGGQRFPLDFSTSDPHDHEGGSAASAEEEKLYQTPGGKYTEQDIQANGNTTASRKYRDFQAKHDTRPRPGEKVCPVTRTKANPNCTWVVGGKRYEFCCPPCIDDFVRRAKERPQTIKEPEKYVKK